MILSAKLFQRSVSEQILRQTSQNLTLSSVPKITALYNLLARLQHISLAVKQQAARSAQLEELLRQAELILSSKSVREGAIAAPEKLYQLLEDLEGAYSEATSSGTYAAFSDILKAASAVEIDEKTCVLWCGKKKFDETQPFRCVLHVCFMHCVTYLRWVLKRSRWEQ